MTKTESDLQSFSNFVHQRLATEPSPSPTLPELFELWRSEDAEFWDTVAVIRRAEADIDKPDCWRSPAESNAALRREFGLDE